jgi:hypothetical protein
MKQLWYHDAVLFLPPAGLFNRGKKDFEINVLVGSSSDCLRDVIF